uniref:Acyl carrier protein n=1 Tax=Trichobilharzia regenti TaxID=157069 RepID=A0AA85IW12_TRIRE|nr:unnamed protein product [Trichobilharzia regenti]
MNAGRLRLAVNGFRRAFSFSYYPKSIGLHSVSYKNLGRQQATFRYNIPCRYYGHDVPITKPMIEDRVMLVLRLYDKVDPNKLTMDSRFREDFGIDSLDHVELVMAMEEEFCFEIPDIDAQRFLTPRDIIQYVCDKHDI